MSNMGVSPLVGIDPSVADRFKASLRIAIKRMQVPQDQILDIVTQLAIMFETGLNLSAALEVLEKQAATPQQAEFVGSIAVVSRTESHCLRPWRSKAGLFLLSHLRSFAQAK